MSSIDYDQFIANAQLALFQTAPLKDAEIIDLFIGNKHSAAFKGVDLDAVVTHILKRMNDNGPPRPTIRIAPGVGYTVSGNHQFTIKKLKMFSAPRNSSRIYVNVDGTEYSTTITYDVTSSVTCTDTILPSFIGEMNKLKTGVCFDSSTVKITDDEDGQCFYIDITLVPNPTKTIIPSALFMKMVQSSLYRAAEYAMNMVDIHEGNAYRFALLDVPQFNAVIAEKKLITLQVVRDFINGCKAGTPADYFAYLGFKNAIDKSGEVLGFKNASDVTQLKIFHDSVSRLVATAVTDHHPGADVQFITDTILADL